jgi:hypothetical protein
MNMLEYMELPAGKRQILASFALAASALLACTLVTSDARANSRMPHTLDAKVTGNSVKICEHRICGGGTSRHEILRRNVATGEVLIIPLHCEDSGCILDECVPPGEYRYGESVAWYGQCYPIDAATVTSPLPEGCVPKLGPERPEKSNTIGPWGDDPEPNSCGGYGCFRCAVPGRSEPLADVSGAGAAAFLLGILLLGRRRKRR